MLMPHRYADMAAALQFDNSRSASRSASAGCQPMGNRGRHLVLRARTDVHADVSKIELERRIIAASDQPLQRDGSFRRHQMIAFADQVQYGHRQSGEIDLAACDLETVLRQSVLLIKPDHELAERFARLVRAVENPLFDA